MDKRLDSLRENLAAVVDEHKKSLLVHEHGEESCDRSSLLVENYKSSAESLKLYMADENVEEIQLRMEFSKCL